MNFRLNEIKIRNFLSIGENGCHIKLDDVNSTLIVGNNGAGKTTILEAITFALYNRTYRKINRNNIINSFVGSDCSVELKLTIGNDVYDVKRTIKPNTFTVWKNGEELDELAGTANQKRFEKILGIDFNVYKQLIVLGTSGYEEFMSLSTGNRRKLLEQILKLDVISIMDEENKGEVKKIELKLDHIQVKLDSLEQQKTRGLEAIELINKVYKEKEEDLTKFKDKIKVLESELELKEKEVEEEKKNLKSIPEVESIQLKELISLPTEFVDKITKAKEQVNNSIQEEKSKVKEWNNNIIKLNNEANTLNTIIERYEHGGSCPSCLQNLDTDNNNLVTIREMVDKINTKIEENKSLIEESNTKIDVLNNKLDKINEVEREKKEELNKENEVIQQHNNSLKLQQQESKHKIQTQENIVNGLIREVNNIQSNIDRYNKEIVDIENYLSEDRKVVDITDIENEIKELIEERDSLNIDLYQRSIITNILKDSGIRSDMINRYIPLFNQSVQKYLDLLGADYIFTVDSNFNETILSRGREDFKYESFSRGEQARIDLAILFSWRDIISKVTGQELTALFLDEVFDSSTDTNGVESIKRVLSSLDGVNIFSISHKEHNPEDFDSVITVNKVGRFSTYERTYN